MIYYDRNFSIQRTANIITKCGNECHRIHKWAKLLGQSVPGSLFSLPRFVISGQESRHTIEKVYIEKVYIEKV